MARTLSFKMEVKGSNNVTIQIVSFTMFIIFIQATYLKLDAVNQAKSFSLHSAI